MLFGPHETNLARGRALSERHVAYYARRAAGGAGVVVTETASVHPDDWPYERAPLASDCGPGWADVVAACRPSGALVLASLGHTGGQGSSAWSQAALWAPSRVPDVTTRELPLEMEQPEIDAVVAGFAGAARIAVDAGVDGVEVDAGARSLLRQFASGLTNLRTDAYGADRLLLLREVLAAVRAELGDGRLLALRLSCDEGAPWAGISPATAVGHVRALAPLVDLLTVVRGSAYADDRPDGHIPPGFNVELTGRLRAVAGGTPMVLQGSMVDVGAARAALARGVADAVEMTRAQIADADLVAKLRRGLAPRPCTLCNQACRVRDVRNPPVSCVVDPSGAEMAISAPEGGVTEAPSTAEMAISAARAEVMVVGAGPAGLEAARALALRGHPVRVVERAAEPGGSLSLVAALPGRSRFADFRDWLVDECRRLGVRIETGVDLGAHDVGARPTVCATGGLPRPAEFAVGGGGVVLAAADVLARVPRVAESLPDGPVVVHDPVGGPVGVGLAELLAAAGRQVTVVTPDRVVGSRLGGDLAPANGRLMRAGVRRETSALLTAVDAAGAVLADRWTGAERRIPCAALVDCGPLLPRAPVEGAALIGDALAPRTVLEAVLDGRRAAEAIAG